MAETIISAIVGDVVSRVISHVIGHYYSYRHQQQSTEAKLQMVRHRLVRIHSAVEEARGKQITNDGTLRWLSELIDAEHQGNYLLDCFKHDLDEEGGEDDEGQVASSLSRFNPAKRARISVLNILPRRRDLTINEEIDRVAERLQGVCDGLREFIMLLGTCQTVHRPLATNIFRHGQMFGRHVEKERIISFLLHDDDDNTCLPVLPIVSDTGVGKTTLVQHACDDARVRNHFDVIMLLDFAYTSAAAATSERSLVLRPQHVIGDAGGIDVSDPLQMVEWDFGSRRFLMVFEDVDMRQKQVLEELLQPRTRCTAGSKIIVTTNNRRVATIGTVKPIMLKVLPFPEYWFFFRAHAFSGRDLEENPRLVVTGKAIAKKLDGSFFGAKIVGGLLMNNPNPGFWRRVSRSSGIEDMSALGDGVNYVMDLSQSLLPGNVCMCQVIVSKDHLFSQTELAGLHGANAAQITRRAWAQGSGFARVLLCESLLPFYNLYYIAECTAGLVNGYSESEVARYLASV